MLICSLRRRLWELDESLHRATELGPAWLLDSWRELEDAFAILGAARRAAHISARAAPRWWRRRAAIDTEVRRATELEVLAASAFGWIHVAVADLPDAALARVLRDRIGQLDRELASVGQSEARVTNRSRRSRITHLSAAISATLTRRSS